MDLSALVQKTQEWSYEEPVARGTPIEHHSANGSRGLQVQHHSWSMARSLRNTFVFNFQSKAEMEEVWKGRPWKVSDTLRNLKKWDSQGKPTNLKLNKGDWWIQIHELPMDFRTSLSLFPILQSILCQHKDMDATGMDESREVPKVWVKFLRALVEVNLEKRLSYGFFSSDRANASWVNFKYERLSQNFC
ncbi:hypothetical protein LINGRAHAP2_LOCUS14055 [Linum grandiflorum]